MSLSSSLETMAEPDIDMRRATVDLNSSSARSAIEFLAEECSSDAKFQEIELTLEFDGWRLVELYLEGSALLGRLREASRLLDRPGNVSDLPLRSIEIELDGRSRSPVGAAVEAWDNSGGVLNGALVNRLSVLGLWDRALVMTGDDDGAMRYGFIGAAQARFLGQSWLRRSLGARHDDYDQGIYEYSRWCDRHYTPVFRTGRPKRDLVDSVLPDPQRPGYSARYNYDRALLPTKLLTGRAALLSITSIEPGLLPLTPSAV